MAEHVIGPWEVDPALSKAGSGTSVLKDADALRPVMLSRHAAAAKEHNFISGFISTRDSEPKGTSLSNTVMWFPDAPAASAAAAGFAELDLVPGIIDRDVPTAQPVPIPDRPETRASTYEFTNLGTTAPSAIVTAYTAHGPFVLMQNARSVDGLDHSVSLINKTLDLQLPAIDGFAPDDPAKRADLRLDETGLSAKTVPQTDRVTIGGVGDLVYGPHATLHFMGSPATSKELFDSNGVDLRSVGRAIVYQARDNEAAEKVAEQFSKDAAESGGTPIAAVPRLEGSRCSQSEGRRVSVVTCVVVADRYVIEAQSPQMTDAHQLTAAQYAMLVAS